MVVNGLEMFSVWFADYKDQYVLIGGTAAAIALNEEGMAFRTTKDLDIVLHLEALTPEFAETFWGFVQRGGYKIQQESETGHAKLYRFQDPVDDEFPYMLELFESPRVWWRLQHLREWSHEEETESIYTGRS